MHEGVDLVAREASPGVVHDGVGCLGSDALPPVSPPDDRAELDVGVLEFGDALKPALADERPGYGISDRPEAPAFVLPAAFVGLQQARGGGAISRPTVDVDHHAGVGEERGRLVEVNNGRAAMLGIMAVLSESKGLVVPPLDYIDGFPKYSGDIMVPFEGQFHVNEALGAWTEAVLAR